MLTTKYINFTDGQGDPWVTRQSLQELYQQILLGDLEYALDKKVEQDLWNHVFKNQISALQRKAKDKTVGYSILGLKKCLIDVTRHTLIL